MRKIGVSLIIIFTLLFIANVAPADERIAVWCLASSVQGCNFLVDGANQSLRDENRYLVQYGGLIKQMAEQKGINLSKLQNRDEAIAAANALELNAILLLSLETNDREDFTLQVQAELIPVSSKSVRSRKIESLVIDGDNEVLHHFGYSIAVLAFQKNVELVVGLPDKGPRAKKSLRDRYFRWKRGKPLPPAYVLFHIDEKGQIDFISHAGSYETKLVNYVMKCIKKDSIWEPAKQENGPRAVYGLLKINFHTLTAGEKIKKEEARKEAEKLHQTKEEDSGDWVKINKKVDGLLIITE